MIIDLCQVCLLIKYFQCVSDVVYICYADTLITNYRSGAKCQIIYIFILEMYFCITECPHGQYGEACEKLCGQCIDPSECHNVHGTCSYGCKPGYKGNHCSQSTL